MARRDAPPSPAGSRKRTGKGQPRAPARASRPAGDSSTEAAVTAARVSAQATKTANRNTSASVRHQPPVRKGFSEMRSGGGALTGGPTAQARVQQGRRQVRLVERAHIGAGRD